jgi:hypothetical protein
MSDELVPEKTVLEIIEQQAIKIKQLEQENAKMNERLKEAENVVNDFVLEKDHTKHCEIGMLNGDCCSCMDRKYYNQESCLERAREYFKKWGSDE